MDAEEKSSSRTTDISSEQSNRDIRSPDATNLTGVEQSSESSPRDASGSLGSIPRRKRKTPDSVTLHACTNCKKAKAKCDGVRPVCKRCASRKLAGECHFEPDAKTARAQMLGEIQRLKRKTETLAEENGVLEETNVVTEQIMSSLKENGHAHEIIKRLKGGDSHETIAIWLQNLKIENLQPTSSASEQRLKEDVNMSCEDVV